MTCDQCPFVIPCWNGTYFRSVCRCGNSMMHESLGLSYLIVRCPRPSPVPSNKPDQECPSCAFDKWKGYQATNVCPELDYYNMRIDEAQYIQGVQLKKEHFQELFEVIARQHLTPTRHILYWDEKKKP